MKWIKGKPKDVEAVIMRRISNRLFVIAEIFEYDTELLFTGKETIPWEDVEWLDETVSDHGDVWREIPVSERLPEREQDEDNKHLSVDVFGIDQLGKLQACCYNFDRKNWSDTKGFSFYPTHWLEKQSSPLKGTEGKKVSGVCKKCGGNDCDSDSHK